jgi:hypothetical protein
MSGFAKSFAYPASLLVVLHADKQPFWGCGILGELPGISEDGIASGGMATMIDKLKATNTYSGKVSYWNWNYAPEDWDASVPGGGHQYLTKDFVFMPENWGVEPVNDEWLRTAGATNYLDSNGKVSKSQMADIFLGANEPDIQGSCMGNMMGACTAPCTPAEASGDCPVAHLSKHDGAKPNAQGHCDCWTDSHSTGVGFWPLKEAPSPYQPLPTCWTNDDCISAVMAKWKASAATVAAKGYKFLSTPLVAVSIDWLDNFMTHACQGCSEISCGCPTHLGWHFYANDCQPENGGYSGYQKKLDDTVKLMEKFPHLQGAIVNEVGMLNCAMDTPDAICIPNSAGQKYPALSQTNHTCPSTAAMPNGLASYIQHLLELTSKAKTTDGRLAVVSFTWFNLNMVGGTYNLRLFDDAGNLNQAGQEYVNSCQAWANSASSGKAPIFA